MSSDSNKNFTKEELRSLNKYTSGGLHINFNKKLRENKPLTDDEFQHYLNLYSIIEKNRIKEDMIVYRGIQTTEKNFLKFLGLNRSFTSTSKTKPFSSNKCCQLIKK